METEALSKAPSWNEYMKEKMPRWTDDKWVAIMLFFSMVPFIAGLAIRSPWMVAVGVVGMIVTKFFQDESLRFLTKLLTEYNKKFPAAP